MTQVRAWSFDAGLYDSDPARLMMLSRLDRVMVDGDDDDDDDDGDDDDDDDDGNDHDDDDDVFHTGLSVHGGNAVWSVPTQTRPKVDDDDDVNDDDDDDGDDGDADADGDDDILHVSVYQRQVVPRQCGCRLAIT